MALQDLLRNRVTIRRQQTIVVSSTGVEKQVWTDVYNDVRASIQARSAFYRLTEAGERQEAQFVGFFDRDVDIQVGDEVVTADGKRYLATYINEPRMHHFEVDLRTNDE